MDIDRCCTILWNIVQYCTILYNIYYIFKYFPILLNIPYFWQMLSVCLWDIMIFFLILSYFNVRYWPISHLKLHVLWNISHSILAICYLLLAICFLLYDTDYLKLANVCNKFASFCSCSANATAPQGW